MTTDQPPPPGDEVPEAFAELTTEAQQILGPLFRDAAADIRQAIREAAVRMNATTALVFLLAEQPEHVGPLLDMISPEHLPRVLDACAVLMGMIADRNPATDAADAAPAEAPSLDSLNAATAYRAAYAGDWQRLSAVIDTSTEQQLDQMRRAATDLLSTLSTRSMGQPGPVNP